MKAVIRNQTLVVEIPLKQLRFGVENLDERIGISLRVSNLAKLGRWFAKTILEFRSESEGPSDFERLLDNVAIDAYEAGEPWIRAVNEEES